jgi:predicted enzyme related to lactoylglutathione lyase
MPVPPSATNGKICYIEIPASDIALSASFYAKVFAWNIRDHGNGHLAFDDSIGGVSGMWVLGRPPTDENGLRVSIMVDSVAATLQSIVAHGGEIHTPIGADPGEITASFRDPYGNVWKVYQEPG